MRKKDAINRAIILFTQHWYYLRIKTSDKKRRLDLPEIIFQFVEWANEIYIYKHKLGCENNEQRTANKKCCSLFTIQNCNDLHLSRYQWSGLIWTVIFQHLSDLLLLCLRGMRNFQAHWSYPLDEGTKLVVNFPPPSPRSLRKRCALLSWLVLLHL